MESSQRQARLRAAHKHGRFVIRAASVFRLRPSTSAPRPPHPPSSITTLQDIRLSCTIRRGPRAMSCTAAAPFAPLAMLVPSAMPFGTPAAPVHSMLAMRRLSGEYALHPPLPLGHASHALHTWGIRVDTASNGSARFSCLLKTSPVLWLDAGVAFFPLPVD